MGRLGTRLALSGNMTGTKLPKIFERGQRVAIFTRSGGEIARGRVYDGDNYPAPNERTTWVKFTYHGETRTDEWPTAQLVQS